MSESSKPAKSNDQLEKLDTYALVELFGHQRIVGRVSEATIAGGAFIRVDVPAFNGAAAFTRFFGPGAIYSINPVTEEIARGLMTHHRNEPVSRFELPQIADKAPTGDAQSYDDYERDNLRSGHDDDE